MLPPPIPNNFGPTLLLAVGLLTAPLLIGLPLVLLALARVRKADGQPAVPNLTAWGHQLKASLGGVKTRHAAIGGQGS